MRMRWTLILLLLLAGCGGSGKSELSKALEECLHNCTPGSSACRDRCATFCAEDCLGDCPGYDCRSILAAFREDSPYGWIQDCVDYTLCKIDCDCYNHDNCLVSADLVFSEGCTSLYDSCKDTCYAF